VAGDRLRPENARATDNLRAQKQREGVNMAGVGDVQVGMRRTATRALTGPAVCALTVLAGCASAAQPTADAATAATAAPAARAAAAGAAGAAAGFRWSAQASSPLGARTSPLVVWAGRQLLEIGGLTANGSKATSAGAAFDPATGRWHRIAPVPGDAAVSTGGSWGLSQYPASAWTGKYLAVALGRRRFALLAVIRLNGGHGLGQEFQFDQRRGHRVAPPLAFVDGLAQVTVGPGAVEGLGDHGGAGAVR
jgi:hypothetical protein